MSENITTIDAGGGIMVDVVEATPKTKKPARTEAQKQARREKAAAAKAAKIAPVAVEPVEETAAEHNRRELADMEIVSESPEAARVRAATETVLDDAAPFGHVEVDQILKDRAMFDAQGDAERNAISEVPVVATVPTIDLATLGMSVALADLADARGMHVNDVVEFHHLLLGAGLPTELPGAVVARANKIQRDAVDAMLWRNNPTARTVADRLSRGESVKEVEVAMTPAPTVARTTSAPTVVREPVAKAARVAKPVVAKVAKKGIFGHATKRVVMLLANIGATREQVDRVMAHFDVQLASSTVNMFMKWGINGEDGAPAQLNAAQLAELKTVAGM